MVWITVKGQPYDTGRAENAEYEKKRRQKEWNEQWITLTSLKTKRNWTDTAIRKYLGEPKDSDGYKIYAMDAVLEAEKLHEFKAWMKKRKAKQAGSTLPPQFQMSEDEFTRIKHNQLKKTVTIFAYARVSTLDQNTDLQVQELNKAYPDAILRTEKVSGTSRNNRPVLDLILDMVQDGDKLIVWKLDRLARNMNDLTNIIEILNQKKASLEIIDQKIDTSTASGKAFLQMLGVFAEFETNLRKERQLAGIAAAKAEGKHLGRKPSLVDKQKRKIKIKHKTGMNPTDLSKEYGVSRATIYNVLKEQKSWR